MTWWKILGLAGILGAVTAVGVVTVRRRREWEEIPPDDLRARLHQRFAEAQPSQ